MSFSTTTEVGSSVAAFSSADQEDFTNSGKHYSEGFHFVVKRNRQTVADLVGSAHTDELGIDRLNPTVEEAAKKAKLVAFEAYYDEQDNIRAKTHQNNSKSKTRQSYFDFHNKTADAPKSLKYHSHPSTSTKAKDVSPNNGTEALILKICETTKSLCVSIETPEEKGEGCNYIELGNEFLRQKLDSGRLTLDDINLGYNEGIAAYRAGDEASFTRYRKWIKLLDPSRYHHLTKMRNFTQANSAKTFIRSATPDNRALIVVGADHLFGKHGVVNLLKNDLGAGYTIERTRPSMAAANTPTT
jgi:uncharacterized protein YbaP (TraB family)